MILFSFIVLIFIGLVCLLALLSMIDWLRREKMKYFLMIDIKDVDRVFDYEAYKNIFRNKNNISRYTIDFINKMRRLKKIYDKT